MTIPTTCRFCRKLSPYPNIIADVILEKKIYAYKLECKDCGKSYWTIWNMLTMQMPPLYIDYEFVKKQHEETEQRLAELNAKAKDETQKLRTQIVEHRKQYKETVKLKRNLNEILEKIMEGEI